MRKISYVQSINETLHQIMDKDKKVFLIGPGVNSPWYAGNSTTGLFKRFGSERIFDTPISENGVTGTAIGAALAGMRPILFHARKECGILAINQQGIGGQVLKYHFLLSYY